MKHLVTIGTAAVLVLFFSGIVSCRAGQGTVTYTHDGAGRMVTAAYSSGGTTATIAYTYDNAGNMTNRKTEKQTTPRGTMIRNLDNLNFTFLSSFPI